MIVCDSLSELTKECDLEEKFFEICKEREG